MKQNGKDLEILLGEPRRAVKHLALALSFSYLVIQLNSFVDSYWTTLLGDVATSAVSTMSPIYWIICSAGIGLGVGAASTVAYHLGEGNREKANIMATNSLILGLAASVITSIAMFFLVNPIITLIGADDVRADSTAYVFPQIVLASGLILNGILTGLLRAEGAGRKSIILLVLSAGLNIILDPILMFTLDMKVAGAGWATAIGATLSVILGLYWYFTDSMEVKIRFRRFHPEKEPMHELLNIGGPRTLEALITGTINVFQRIPMVIAGGTLAIMMYNIPFKYPSLIIVIAEALRAAMIPVCSAALGQKDVQKMKAGMRYSMRLSFCLTASLAAIVFILADPLMEVFTQSDSMATHKEELVWVLRMFCFFVPFDGLRKMGSSMLQVLGKSKISTIAMMAWGLMKLVAYSIGAMFSFHSLIVAAVAIYIFGGIWMIGLASYFAKKKYGTALL